MRQFLLSVDDISLEEGQTIIELALQILSPIGVPALPL